ncbi:S-adenosyl-L-methionine-dependent methyltransferase [Daldinia caldariorum]|uniref:S-adenosyl-L-methionine-dependent methyltransferase n=1 Tax=Daldinia caldariorum TaxID=326644 RepID=UPI002008ACD1|nr:S-adenosyl-L-methionine-dependent methyltransferase [Daldinia caldariorum]KAI1466694.1 S-adenosyl-L-methionine-dependent methyltransferase [Daldinia caldariorum]
MTVTALADIIRTQAEILETSLPRHAYTDYHGDKSLSIARSKLLEACDKLNHLYVLNKSPTASQNVMGIAQGHRVHAALQYVCHFRLASFVPADGTPITYADLARAAGVDTSQCTRVLQLLMTYHIFREPGTRIVAHNRNSRVLLDDDTGAAVEWLTQESLRSSAFFTETRAVSRRWSTGTAGSNDMAAAAAAPATIQGVMSSAQQRTALDLACAGIEQPAVGFLAQQRMNAETSMKAERYARAMAGMAKRRQLSVEHLVSGYEWGELPAGTTVVDVGGGNGHCSRAIAACNPSLSFVVQDSNTALLNSEVDADDNADDDDDDDDESGDRLKFMAYDFFKPQTVAGDVYLLRRILHHYSDQDAVRILQAQLCGARSKPEARIVVMDNIAIHSGTLSTLEERKTRYDPVWTLGILTHSFYDVPLLIFIRPFLRTLDIAMMALFNSVERSLDGWKELFKMADPKLKLVKVTKPLGSALAVMELRLDQT